MSNRFKPLGNRVLIQRCKPPATKGGILLPDSAQKKPQEGVVLAIGPGKVNDEGVVEPLTIKTGDRVLFSSYAGNEVKTEGDEELLILSEDDVLAIVS